MKALEALRKNLEIKVGKKHDFEIFSWEKPD
jgi:hypothetical protein